MLTNKDLALIREIAQQEIAKAAKTKPSNNELPFNVEIPDDSPLARLPNTEPRKEA